MGMFDEIIYKDQVYQTKDTPDQFLTTYEIRGDELWKEHVEYDWVENVDDIFGGHLKRISSEWKFESDFDGAIRFYRMIESGEKMIVVVIVLSIILLGIASFLFYLERRLSKAERELKKLQQEKTEENSGQV